MSNMIEYKENVITKMRNFFKSLFKKEKNTVVENINASDTRNLNEEKKFLDEVKSQTNDEADIVDSMDKDRFLEYIDGNVEALKSLSTDRLEKLKEYYAGVIENNNNKIQKLKASNN